MIASEHRPILWIWLTLLLAASLGVRLGWSFFSPSDEATLQKLPDQAVYLDLARNLLHHQGLVHIDERFATQVLADRMPLYPLFLAACRANITAIRIVQSIIDTSTVLAIFLLARRFLSPWPSLLAAALVAFNPFLIYFSALILTETLFTAMLAWGMLLLTSSFTLVFGGLLLAASILVRPSAIALPIVLGIAAAFVNRATQPQRRSWWPIPVGTTMLLLTIILLLPWATRNRVVLGQWLWTTTNSGFVAFDGFNDQATGGSDQSELASAEWNGRLRRLGEVDRSEVLSESARQWLARTWRQEPSRIAKLTATKIARTWSPMPLSQDFSSRRNCLVALLFSIPFDLLIVLGLWKGSLPPLSRLFLALPAAYFTIVHAMSVGSLRYRVPVEPVLAVLAAAGAMTLLQQLKKSRHRIDPQPRRSDSVQA